MNDMTIGELARRSGVSVRTLHHYDRIGLLRPKARSAAGYRLYGESELRRMSGVQLLKQMGLSLDEISRVLNRQQPLDELIQTRIQVLNRRIEADQRLLEQLTGLCQRARSGEWSSDDLFRVLEALKMYEKYHSREQQAALERRRRGIG